MSMFRAKKLDLGGFVNIKVIRDHTKRKVFAQNEPERYLPCFFQPPYNFRMNALQGNLPGVKKASW
ncbi:hypothetical protein B2J93_9455 [Marssonina coronariae]|uniref:Uncharacterized protein n=1 Tax=Diplocarpon coronariae TaxID=2795749 RepID=A0A218YV96_9HELO|nr:hypothetical protein B2J93_9455 [Marssonina coronariae]